MRFDSNTPFLLFSCQKEEREFGTTFIDPTTAEIVTFVFFVFFFLYLRVTSFP